MDYFTTNCPNCVPLSAKQKQAVLSSIIQIQTDCPMLGDSAMSLYNRGQIFTYSYDDTTWGKFYMDSTQMALWAPMFNITVSDTLYHTLRHEAEHYANGADEGMALYAQDNCPQ